MDNFDNRLTFMDAMLYAIEGENPSKAIENQEKRGAKNGCGKPKTTQKDKRPLCSR